MPNLFSVILAGGSGTRFWPLSRRKRPKQLLALAGEESLIKATQKRLAGLVSADRRLVISNQDQGARVRAELEGLVPEGNLLLEPVGRDTAAAAILGALAVRARDPEGIMVLLPADHVIEPSEGLVQAVRGAAERASTGRVLLTIGIRPDHPATGYGYIKRGEPTTRAADLDFFRVDAFREKPDAESARSYLEDGGYFWNSGIFIWSATTILELAGRFLPDTLNRLEPLVSAGQPFPGPEELRDAFLAIKKISVDFGILEKAPQVEVVEAPFAWDDVGAWTAIENHVTKDEGGNAVRGLAHLLNTRGTTIISSEEHLVAAIGLEDLVIVHTENATLVARKEDVQAVKDLVAALEERGLEAYT